MTTVCKSCFLSRSHHRCWQTVSRMLSHQTQVAMKVRSGLLMLNSDALYPHFLVVRLPACLLLWKCLYSSTGGGRTKSRKKVRSKNKGAAEGGEETDEGDMESWEVDYMSDASSVSEKGYKVIVKLRFCGWICIVRFKFMYRAYPVPRLLV